MMLEIAAETLQLSAIALSATASLLGAAHALLTRRDPHSAAVWISVCVFFPLVGVLVYVVLGNDRIRTRARRLQVPAIVATTRLPPDAPVPDAGIAAEYRNLASLGRVASGNELLAGNRVVPLFNGEEAYPAMLAAIAGAREYVHLATYIFDAHGVGMEFVQALAAAVARGVAVRVLLDGAGEWYSIPRAGSVLQRHGVSVARFLPPRLLPPNFTLNLRNHRKLLVIDGEVAFTGGMNIRDKHRARPHEREPRVLDVHFRLEGPVIAQLDALFRSDWAFCSHQPLAPAAMPVDHRADAAAAAACRLIVDGPAEDQDRLLWVMIGAIVAARASIRIMTPYFLPPRELMVALQTAALRGVEVTVLLPGHNNFAFMTWAAMHTLGELLRAGVRVHFFTGPFVHTKLMLIDDYYVQLGSANIDPRSLRLNFEMAVEVYDRGLAARLAEHFAAGLQRSRPWTHADWRRRRLPQRLRDALVWLFSPYL